MKKLEKFTKNIRNSAFISKYNWDGINYQLGNDDWKRLEKTNLLTAVNVLHVQRNENIFCLQFKTTQSMKNTI